MTIADEPSSPTRQRIHPRTVFVALIAGALVTGCLYAFLAYRFWSDKPRLGRDIVAELNAPAEKLPPAERAWPRLRAALIQLRPGLDRWRLSTRTAADWQDLETLAAQNSTAVAELRDAALLPHLGYVYAAGYHREDWPLLLEHGANSDDVPADEQLPSPVANAELLQVILLPQQYLEYAIAVLVADSRRATDSEAIVENIKTITNLVRLMQDPPMQVSLVQSWKAFGLCLDHLGRLLSDDSASLTDEQLAEIDACLREFSDQRVKVLFQDQRDFFADIEQRWYTDDGHGDGYLYPFPIQTSGEGPEIDLVSLLLLPLAADRWRSRSVSRKEFREKVEELFQLAEQETAKPLWEASEVPPHIAEIQQLAEDRRWFLVALMFPDTTNVYEAAHRSAMHAEALRTAVALRRYRLGTQKWPDSLETLVPDFIAKIPTDRYVGQPLRYRLEDGTPMLYSLYRDRHDDGGTPHPETNPQPTVAELIHSVPDAKGDLVLWPEPRFEQSSPDEDDESTPAEENQESVDELEF